MRLFVALDLPEPVRAALREIQSRLKPLARSARWVPIENMHLTLKFIGHVSGDAVAGIRQALANVRAAGPVSLRVQGVGFFPDERRPRVFWCGMEHSHELAALAGAIEAAVEPLGIPREKRSFVPHLTLARMDPPRPAPELVRSAGAFSSFDFGILTAGEFHLYESVLRSSGAEYRKLASFPLAEPAG